MAESTFVFESGDPVAIGEHGEHDYVFVSGEPLTDFGASDLVFESGTGIGAVLDGSVAQYKFEDEGDTSTATDSIDGYDMDAINGPTWTTDSYEGDHALSLDGNDDYTQSTSTLDVFNEGDQGRYTVEGWYKTDNTGQTDRNAMFGNYVGQDNHALIMVSSGENGVSAGNVMGFLQQGTDNEKLGNTSLSSTWTHVAYVVYPGEHELYIDGNLDASQSHNRAVNDIGSGTFLTGVRPENSPGSSADDWFAGELDNIVHYARALSQTEIQERAAL